MNAHAQQLMRPATHDAAPPSEHISLESEPEVAAAPKRAPVHKIRSTYKLDSWLRGCTNEVSILENHFLSVNCGRPNTPARPYVLDLRFVNAKPLRARRISWLWLAITLTLIIVASAAMWMSVSAGGFNLRSPALLGGGATLLTGLAALAMFLRCTTESLQFTSVHGQATLVSITGGMGSARTGKKFFVELIKNINAAKNARQQPKQQWLRDEMREHHRLRELGILSEEQYEASKARILAAHS